MNSNKLKSAKKISVVIRCKNEERWIGHTIQSILDAIKKPEIVIIDDNSQDNTINIVKYFIQDSTLIDNEDGNFTDIKIFNIVDYSPGKSLNLGVKNATYNNILMISAHCVLKNINIEKHLKDLNKFVCIFGNQNPIWNGKKIKKRYLWSHFVDNEVENMYSDFENRFFLHNAISIYKKDLLLKYPFDEYLQSKEDRYWCNQVINLGNKVLYDPQLEVDHHYTEHGNTWKGIG